MINREEALALLQKYIRDQDLIRDSLAVESLLKVLAKKLQEDEELWGLVGLLHKLDYQYTSPDNDKRGTIAAQILEGLLPESAINAIKAYNYTHTGYIPTTILDKGLITAETTIGLIYASARSLPSKSLLDLNVDILFSKYNDSNFAPDISRNKIRLCVDIGFDIETFFTISLDTLQNIFFEVKP